MFLPVLSVGDAYAALAFEHQPRHVRPAFHVQVLPRGCRLQVAVYHAPAPATMLEHLVIANAFLVAAVVVGVQGLAVFLSGAQKGVGHGKPFGHFFQVHGAIFPARVAPGFVMLDLAEDALGLRMAPSRCTRRFPAIVILGLAAHVDHAVDQGGAAHALAARHRDGPAIDVVFGLGGEPPVVVGVHQQLGEARRDGNPHAARLLAGLQHQDAMLAVGAEPVGQDAARRAAARNNEIEITHRYSPRPDVACPALIAGPWLAVMLGCLDRLRLFRRRHAQHLRHQRDLADQHRRTVMHLAATGLRGQ
ncbi:hypothetical protein D3C72_1075090 [compost metagenome]